MSRVPVTPTRQAADAIDLLAGLTRRGRHRRGWTQGQLAERLSRRVDPRAVEVDDDFGTTVYLGVDSRGC